MISTTPRTARRRHRARSSWLGLACVLSGATAWAMAACGAPSTGSHQAHVQGLASDGSRSTSTSNDPTTTTSPTTPTPTVTTLLLPAVQVTVPPTSPGAELAIVEKLLNRYDHVVTTLAISPQESENPLGAARVAFSGIVPPDTSLFGDVLSQLVVRPLADGTRLLPGSDGLSYHHHAVVVGAQLDDAIDFTWCGYSPGIRVDTASGTVLDDGVARVAGTGRVRSDTTGWVLDALDHMELTVLPAGSADPCVEDHP